MDRLVTDIGIAGIAGRMGCLLAGMVRADQSLHLAGGTTRRRPAPDGVVVARDIAALASASDVVVDFTTAAAVADHAAALTRSGTGWVLGTTGLDAEAEAVVAGAGLTIPIVYAANFAPGVVALLAVAEMLGAALPASEYDAEIVEMHHRQKIDAPSGTAIALGRAVAAGRRVALEDVRASGRDGHTGERPTGAIGFAALRGGQVVGEHTVLFAGASEHVALSHRAFDRAVFAAGALRAARWLAGRPAGLYTMRDVLGLGGAGPPLA
jgi:4-hydroxy-tetrahydrodipicolinate reductase